MSGFCQMIQTDGAVHTDTAGYLQVTQVLQKNSHLYWTSPKSFASTSPNIVGELLNPRGSAAQQYQSAASVSGPCHSKANSC